MLACVLGRDSLYEHGYITVEEGGKIRISPDAWRSRSIAKYVRSHLEGKVTPWWTPRREEYFQWHRTRVFRKTAELTR